MLSCRYPPLAPLSNRSAIAWIKGSCTRSSEYTQWMYRTRHDLSTAINRHGVFVFTKLFQAVPCLLCPVGRGAYYKQLYGGGRGRGRARGGGGGGGPAPAGDCLNPGASGAPGDGFRGTKRPHSGDRCYAVCYNADEANGVGTRRVRGVEGLVRGPPPESPLGRRQELPGISRSARSPSLTEFHIIAHTLPL
ncbi:hypothetical protein FKP32DRAFT_15539 [Trametes sanguinea]|nr:hypothetical protein FKP32DRAFT_15539 [Trametes sanguinea]